jgi:hypothetical protein
MQNHPIIVGSIFYVRWGYEQTNINFYQVINLIGTSTLELQELAQNETFNKSSLTGTTLPLLNQFLGASFRKRVNADGFIKISEYDRYARIWDEEPLYFSTYA